MAKYGKGLNREIVAAVNAGVIKEPIDIGSVRYLASLKKWDVPDSYINVALANAASETHSHTYKKYFVPLGDGKYELKSSYRT